MPRRTRCRTPIPGGGIISPPARRCGGIHRRDTGSRYLELTPQEPHLAADLDYNNSESRVCREHADPALQDVAPHLYRCGESWERYDTVFVGYPIWWGGKHGLSTAL